MVGGVEFGTGRCERECVSLHDMCANAELWVQRILVDLEGLVARLDCGEFGARDRVAKIAVRVDGVTEPWAIGTA